jgi:hypothetical protein
VKLKLRWYFIVIIIIILFSAVAVFYRGQDIKQFAFGIFNVQFWPKQQQQTQPSKDFPEQTKRNTPSEINQHTEGDQSPAVNIAPGGKANFNYNVQKDGKIKE